ncbi:uncharacterized protein K02A2.6-like [Patiria miniata]|uniref:Endonuclease n=1 Tax=Patiria miniata TaxID=46514 RepID=A0A914AI64_PATMI|nr:uncharacterized protein K02A2.6-like [Patiria miniata]
MAQTPQQGAHSRAPLIGRLDKYDEVEDIRNYVERLNLYFQANDIAQEKKTAVLLSAVGPTVYKTAKSLAEPTPVTEKTYTELCELLIAHYGPKRLVVSERFRFYKRHQQPSETIAQYAMTLQNLASTCKFGQFLDDALRDRLVCGLTSNNIQKHLLTKDGLTFKAAVDLAKTLETAVKDLREFKNSPNADTVSVHALHRNAKQPYKQPYKPSFKQPPPQTRAKPQQGGKSCSRCGRDPSHQSCPASGQKCNYCQKLGHFSVVCRAKPKKLHTVQHDPTDSDDGDTETNDFFVGTVHHTSHDILNGDVWRQPIKVQGQMVQFLLDTGSEVNILPANVYKSLKLSDKTLQPTTLRLHGYFGGKAKPLGQKKLSCEMKNRQYSLVFQILASGQPVIGKTACEALGLIQRVYTMVNRDNVFEGTGCLEGPPVNIKLTDSATPYCVTAPRRIPLPLLPQLKQELEKMETQGIVKRITEPTEWCAPIVIVPKKNNQIRLCVDLRQLNKAVQRERFTIPSLEEVLGKIVGAQVFSLLDAKHGFWQIPLASDSQKLTTFITPFGRFCFTRLPFGITSAPELYQRIMCDLLVNLDGVVVYMDDILITGRTQAEHDQRVHRVVQILQKAGLRLNKEKSKFSQETVTFLGLQLDKDGIHADPSKITAIVQMPPPTSKDEVKRLMGMVNWLSRFIPNAASVAAPITDLLKDNVDWMWGAQQKIAFRHLKTLLTRSPTLAFYDPAKPTMVSADASSYGLGGCLLQQHEDETWKPVAYCSRTLTPAERKYAQIEKELLASVWACERFYVYIRGLHVTLQTDHKPLVSLINSKDLCDAPLRCQRLLMRLMKFHCTAVYSPGKTLVVADTLSRAPVHTDQTADDSDDLAAEIAAHVSMVTSQWPASDAKLAEITDETVQDNVLSLVSSYVKDGWPKYIKDVDPDVKRYWEEQDKISQINGILTYGDRIIIPQKMQQEMLEKLHEGHHGVTKSRLRANQAIWWPGIGTDIAQHIQQCEFCREKQPAQKAEPLMSTPLPQRAWQRIACDLAELKGKVYLVIVDYYSRWIEIHHLVKTTALAVINFMKTTFARYGIPEVVVSDNGPQFLGEFQQFAREFGFNHITTSPHYPQANGQAEKAVHVAKSILRQPDPIRALMTYRATPLPSLGVSPASLMMGRELRTTLPMLPKNLLQKPINQTKLKQADAASKSKGEVYFNQKHGAKALDQLETGARVKIRTKGKLGPIGEVLCKADTPRSYIVRVNGAEYRRNRRHIVRMPQPPPEPDFEIQLEDPVQQNPDAQQQGVRQSQRMRKPPAWQQDYVMY